MTEEKKVSARTSRARELCGQQLKQLREARGHTQRTMATAIGVGNHTFVSQVERGYNRLPPEQIKIWAKALGIPAKELTILTMRYYEPHQFKILFQDEPDTLDGSRFEELKPREIMKPPETRVRLANLEKTITDLSRDIAEIKQVLLSRADDDKGVAASKGRRTSKARAANTEADT